MILFDYINQLSERKFSKSLNASCCFESIDFYNSVQISLRINQIIAFYQLYCWQFHKTKIVQRLNTKNFIIVTQASPKKKF